MTARTISKRAPRPIKKAHEAVAVIIDGETEDWYIKQVKAKYNPSVTRTLRITPEFPEKKKVKELFKLAQVLIERETYTTVFLIIDLDEVLKQTSEWNCFQEYYSKYRNPGGKYKWMEKVRVIINTPCLEYWYMLHFKATTRFYNDYSSLRPDLRKIPTLSGYEKSEAYYNGTPKIYDRLSSHLSIARGNAYDFDLATADQKGCSEMFKIFDFIDEQAQKYSYSTT